MVMTFRQRMEYLDEVRRKNIDMSKHPHGTYVAAHLSKASRDELSKWVSNNNIPNQADPKQYHTTITYSRKGVPEVNEYNFELPIKGKITNWKIFPSQGGKNCLVAIVESSTLEQTHKTIQKQYSATYDYPDYIPHITVSYDYGKNPIPSDIPNIDVTYNRVKIEPLDAEYISIKKD